MFVRDVEMFIDHCENKGLSQKTIGSYEQTLRLLMLWLDEQGFCTNKGKFLEVSNFEKNVRKYAQRVGLKDIHPHVFRNNFAKRFLMNGGDIYTLSKILGYSSVTVTEKAYLDLTGDDLAEMYRKHSPLKNMR